MLITRRATLGAIALAPAIASRAWADTYPSRPIKMIVPFPPGASTDVLARLTDDGAEQMLKQPVVLENIGGGLGTIAGRTVASAAADGYTLLFAGGNVNAVNYELFKDPGYRPDQFTGVIEIGATSHLFTVRNALPVHSMEDLIALAKSEPGKLNFGSGGIGGSGHLLTELFMLKTGIKMIHIPYNGGALMAAAYLGGEIDVVFGTIPTLIDQAKAGTFRTLATSNPTRLPDLPNVPTMIELGYPDMNCDAWYGVAAPAATPPAIINLLYTSMLSSIRTPKAVDTMNKIGLRQDIKDPAAFTAFMTSEVAKYKTLIPAIGLKPQ